MNSVTQSQRRWRKKSKRGVSPIIATILLVAITVVLAAVLYILISGLTKGPGNTPLGTALALGTPAEAAKGTNNWYNFSVQSAGGGILLNNLNFQVQTPSGGIVPATGSWTFNVLSLTATVIGTYSMSANTWTAGGTASVTSQEQFVLNAVSSNLSGDTLITIGTGSYQGSISTNIP
jgi:flagellin-like protein